MKTFSWNTIAGLAAIFAALSPGVVLASTNAVKYNSVLLRPLKASMPGLLEFSSGPIDPAAILVEGIRTGDEQAVDEVLDSGELGIDEPICFTMGRAGETLETGKESWLLTAGLRSATEKAINPTGDPRHAMFIPDTPGVSTFGDSWQSSTGNMNMYNMPESAFLHGTPLMVAARFGNRFMVKHLLKRGANPNVFIVVGRTSNGFKSLLGKNTEPVSRPYLFALEECYREADGIQGKTRAKMDECANILIAAGAVLPPEDKQGRNGLWDAAIARSIPMLELAVKSGIDVNAVDHLDKSVADYIAESGINDPDLNAFARALRDKGAKGTTPEMKTIQPQPMGEGEDDVLPPQPTNADGGGNMPIGGTMGSMWTPSTGFVPGRNAPDNAAEIARLELQLVALRKQLLDAKHDADMAAIHGTGWITASMRVQNIMQAISETEGRLLALQR